MSDDPSIKSINAAMGACGWDLNDPHGAAERQRREEAETREDMREAETRCALERIAAKRVSKTMATSDFELAEWQHRPITREDGMGFKVTVVICGLVALALWVGGITRLLIEASR